MSWLSLLLGPDRLFRRFSENKRTNIKKAVKFEVSVDIAETDDDISAYFAICANWSRRKALPMMHERRFREDFRIDQYWRLFLARHEGQIIAGIVIRFFRGVMEYAANSSLQSALRLRPNDLLHWRAIEWGCAQGLTKYSLGALTCFSRKFRGDIVPTTRCRIDLSLFCRFAIGDWGR